MDLLATITLKNSPGEMDVVFDGSKVSYFPDNRMPKDSKKLFLVAERRIPEFGFGSRAPDAPVESFVFTDDIRQNRKNYEQSRFFVAFLYQLFYVLRSMAVDVEVSSIPWVLQASWEPVPFRSEVPLIF